MCTALTSAAKLARGETSALAEVMRAKAAAIARAILFMVGTYADLFDEEESTKIDFMTLYVTHRLEV